MHNCILPFDNDGEESLGFQAAATHCGSEWLALAVAEEEHLQDVGVIHRNSTSSHLPITVLWRETWRAQSTAMLETIHFDWLA